MVPNAPIDVIGFDRFKQFKKSAVTLRPGVTLVAGGNNSGKSSLLQGLAVWEFCKTATLMERGPGALLPAATSKQGFGLGDDEFSPINIPSLKHLWTNLRTREKEDSDGYTLRVGCTWKDSTGEERRLVFGLALTNDRLFIRVAESDLAEGTPVPRVAYLPPFAGITAREQRINGAMRRRRIGEGLAGAVLRNLILDMHEANAGAREEALEAAELRRRQRLEESGKGLTTAQVSRPARISDGDLTRLRESDAWELLQQALRDVFKAELVVDAFREEYHSYIKVEVVKGTVSGYQLTRYPNYSARDLMVEGSGFLQWLSVYTLATTPDVDVVLFDEPDAHLHPSLQRRMLQHLERLAEATGKQVLLATHSSELLRSSSPRRILQMRSGGKTRYLSEEAQKVGLLEGIGSDYAPHIDRIRETRRVFFYEGTSDLTILSVLADKIGSPLPEEWVGWQTTRGHKERRHVWDALREDIPEVVAFSIRDRDDTQLALIGDDLAEQGQSRGNFMARTWRRRYVESYLLWPPAIAQAAGSDLGQVERDLTDRWALSVGERFRDSKAPMGIVDARAKDILAHFQVSPVDVARALPVQIVPEDIRAILSQLRSSIRGGDLD